MATKTQTATPTITSAEFQVDANELVRVLHNGLVSAAKDPGRPVLAAIKLDQVDGLLRSVSTDSYRLGIDTAVLTEVVPAPWSFLLDRADADAILKMVKAIVKRSRHLGPAPITVTVTQGDHATLAVAFDGQTYTAREVDGEFPNWERLMPEENRAKCEPTTHVAFNPVFLADLAKVIPFDHYGNAGKVARFDLNGPTRPAVITIGATYKGLLMPVRTPEA